jgi:hypothetical protein
MRMETEISLVEDADCRFVDRRRKVWLECNAELYDLRAVVVLNADLVTQDIPILTYVCPRCGEQHRSLILA